MDLEKHKKIILWLVASVMFMEMIDTSILNTAIPEIAKSFQTTPISLKFAITSYLVSLAIFIPASGFMADRFGTRTIFASAIVIFTVSSILCGLSNNLVELSIFRALQGLGGALMTPVARLIMVRAFPPHELIKATTYAIVPALIGPILGPLIGGFFTQYLHWRWVFFVNVPMGVGAFFFVFRYVENEIAQDAKKFDLWGFILSGVALASLAFAFESLGERVLSIQTTVLIAIAGAVSLFLFLLLSFQKKENSILNLQLFKIRTFRIGVLGNFISITAFGGISFILPLLMQLQFGFSPFQSGILVAPVALGGVIIRAFSPRIIKKFGFKAVTQFAPLGVFVSFVLLSFITANSSYLYIVISGILAGIFNVMLFSTNGPLIYVNIPKENSSGATSLDVTIRQFGMSLSIGLSAFLLLSFLNIFHFKSLNDNGTIKVFHYTFLILAVLSLGQILFSLGLNKEDGQAAAMGQKSL